jgi:hypothetical protein
MPCINTSFFALIYPIPFCVSTSTLPKPHSYKRSEQVPDNNSFLRRALLSGERFLSEHWFTSFGSQLICLVAVVGDYAYIEGGELSSKDDYESTPGNMLQKILLISGDLIFPSHCHIIHTTAGILDEQLSHPERD